MKTCPLIGVCWTVFDCWSWGIFWISSQSEHLWISRLQRQHYSVEIDLFPKGPSTFGYLCISINYVALSSHCLLLGILPKNSNNNRLTLSYFSFFESPHVFIWFKCQLFFMPCLSTLKSDYLIPSFLWDPNSL